MAAKRNDGWDLDEAPATGVKPPSTGRVRTVKVALWSVLVAGVLAPIMLIAAGAAVLKANSLVAATGAPVAVSSPGRLAATIAINRWLASTPAPLVSGQVMSWDGSRIIPTTVVTDRNGKTTSPQVGYVSEIDSFSLVDGFGLQYTASIQVQVDPRTKTGSAVGSPSLLPVVGKASDSWQNGGPWPGLTGTSVPDAIHKATAGWASAYISGDGSSLRIAVGDPDPNHMYVPLSGVDQVGSDVVVGAVLNLADPSVMIVQVKLVMHWVSQPALSSTDLANKDRPGIVLDLLVERANTAAPVITAWGAPGAGTTLTRYGNAVDGTGRSTSTAAPTITASPSPSVTGSPTVSGS